MTIELLNIDCMKYMKACADKSFDLAIVDPPYFDGPNKTGYYGKGYSKLNVKRAEYYDSCDSWQVPGHEYFIELKRISKNQIIWGANHFAGLFDSSSPCWIVWDKDNGSSSFADCELAYTSFLTAVRCYKYRWNGMIQGVHGDKKKNETRIHPTQKPINLYKWLLQKYAEPGQRIIDTHLGSGSSAIAAYYFGVDFVGCELNTRYFRDSMKRYYEQTKQHALF